MYKSENIYMKNKLTIFTLLGIAYIFIEVMFTSITTLKFSLIGQSSLWMFLVGGCLGMLLGKINEIKSFQKLSHLVTVLLGATAITLIELLSGLILNIVCGFGIWNYTLNPLNFLGQIDIIHSTCWIILTPFVFWIDDIIKFYMINTPKPPALYKYYIRNIKLLK